MLCLDIYRSITLRANACDHPSGKISASVDIRCSVDGEKILRLNITPDQADALAAELKRAAVEAREMEAARLARIARIDAAAKADEPPSPPAAA